MQSCWFLIFSCGINLMQNAPSQSYEPPLPPLLLFVVLTSGRAFSGLFPVWPESSFFAFLIKWHWSSSEPTNYLSFYKNKVCWTSCPNVLSAWIMSSLNCPLMLFFMHSVCLFPKHVFFGLNLAWPKPNEILWVQPGMFNVPSRSLI